MRQLRRLGFYALGFLLVAAAPAVSACEGLGAMAEPCPMMRAMDGMRDAAPAGGMGHASPRREMAESPCHQGGRMSDDCCALRSLPDPAAATRLEGAWRLAAPELTGVALAPPRPAAGRSPLPTSDRGGRWRGEPLYRAYSTLLL